MTIYPLTVTPNISSSFYFQFRYRKIYNVSRIRILQPEWPLNLQLDWMLALYKSARVCYVSVLVSEMYSARQVSHSHQGSLQQFFIVTDPQCSADSSLEWQRRDWYWTLGAAWAKSESTLSAAPPWPAKAQCLSLWFLECENIILDSVSLRVMNHQWCGLMKWSQ